jgi:putative hydrolase of HD superfamily
MLRGVGPAAESVAAHSFGVSVAAMMLADAARARGLEVDVERVLRMALLHDLAEARLGDMPRTAAEYFGAEARKRAERAAFADIVRNCPAGLAELYSRLHEDYERRESLEARIVKAADIIDLLVQVLAFERAGVRGLDEFWEDVRERGLLLEGAAGEAAAEMLRELLAERARLEGEDGEA